MFLTISSWYVKWKVFIYNFIFDKGQASKISLWILFDLWLIKFKSLQQLLKFMISQTKEFNNFLYYCTLSDISP